MNTSSKTPYLLREDSMPDDEKSYKNDDYDLVADLIQQQYWFITIRETKDIWYYDKTQGIYKPFGHTIIEEECQKLIAKCKKQTVAEVIDTIRRNKTYVDRKELFESKEINTSNGILNPITFELDYHSPEYLTKSQLPFSVNFEARNLKLWNHILTIIDPKDINLIMELIWICISGNNPFKKMFVFKGITNTQKSTLADIISCIIGNDNVSREKPTNFLSNGSRFSTKNFIGKNMNVATEIGNLTQSELENLKSLVGAELQNTERKNDNSEIYFDPTQFVFLFTTNNLGKLYSSIDDNSVITRFQFIIFRNQLNESKSDGQWEDKFFINSEDKQSAIDTIVNIVINYKKAQSLGKIPKTSWSSIAKTKDILKEQMPLEDKYFEDNRIVESPGNRLILDEIRIDFEKFVGYNVKNSEMGNILKKNGFHTVQSNSKTILKGYSFKNILNDKCQVSLA